VYQNDSSNLESINLQYFNSLLDDSIVTKSDLHGNITYINDNFTKATGFSQEDAIGKNHNIMRHPDTPNNVFQELWGTIKTGKIFRGRVLNKKKDGSDFWAETTVIPLIDKESKEVINYIAIRNDITDFLHMKRNIIKHKAQKEEQKMISKAKDSFLVLFTHELKTPLNAIINFSKYLLKNVGKTDIEKQKKLLTQIGLSSTKMLENVTDLLELSRLKANKLEFNLTKFNVYNSLIDVINSHESLANEHNIKVLQSNSCRTCYIKSDIFRFKQIIANILSNAIKYSKSTVHIYVTCTDTTTSVTIEDDGNGIKNKEKALEMFEQTEGDVKLRSQKGTGIGLSFVKLLCDELKFEYKLEDSEKLGGVKFTITTRKVSDI